MPTSASTLQRKTRSDKFPLTRHPTGQYCKKIRGKLYYFGKNKQQALDRYLEQASLLHAGRTPPPQQSEELSLRTLCNLYLSFQESKMQRGELSASHYDDQREGLRKFARFIGPHTCISDIATLDLHNYKHTLATTYSKHRLNLFLSIMKAMFNWAVKHEVLQRIPNIAAIEKAKIPTEEKPTFTISQIHVLLTKASPTMRAMILLGLNCGFGCTDCASLKWEHIDFTHMRIRLPRSKTGIRRNLPLWAETIAALQHLSQESDHVFITRNGNLWVRTAERTDKNGTTRYSNINAVTTAFAKLLKKTGLTYLKGVGFYTLRRTAATLAAQSGDPFAVQRLLGHADLKMASTYVQDVSEQTDRVINQTRQLIVQGNS